MVTGRGVLAGKPAPVQQAQGPWRWALPSPRRAPVRGVGGLAALPRGQYGEYASRGVPGGLRDQGGQEERQRQDRGVGFCPGSGLNCLCQRHQLVVQ